MKGQATGVPRQIAVSEQAPDDGIRLFYESVV
jgi:hypothetical protein